MFLWVNYDFDFGQSKSGVNKVIKYAPDYHYHYNYMLSIYSGYHYKYMLSIYSGAIY